MVLVEVPEPVDGGGAGGPDAGNGEDGHHRRRKDHRNDDHQGDSGFDIHGLILFDLPVPGDRRAVGGRAARWTLDMEEVAEVADERQALEMFMIWSSLTTRSRL